MLGLELVDNPEAITDVASRQKESLLLCKLKYKQQEAFHGQGRIGNPLPVDLIEPAQALAEH